MNLKLPTGSFHDISYSFTWNESEQILNIASNNKITGHDVHGTIVYGTRNNQ